MTAFTLVCKKWPGRVFTTRPGGRFCKVRSPAARNGLLGFFQIGSIGYLINEMPPAWVTPGVIVRKIGEVTKSRALQYLSGLAVNGLIHFLRGTVTKINAATSENMSESFPKVILFYTRFMNEWWRGDQLSGLRGGGWVRDAGGRLRALTGRSAHHAVGRPLIVSASGQQRFHFTCTTSYPEEDSPSRSAS